MHIIDIIVFLIFTGGASLIMGILGMLGLFLLGYLSKKARNIDAAVGVACGLSK